MNLLIGGAGLIGSHIGRLAPAVTLDDLSRGDRRNVTGDFIQGCVTEKKLVEALIERSSYVFFLAALPVLDCDKYPDKARLVMVDGVRHVAETCKRYGRRLIYSSSGSVYGEVDEPVTESHPLNGTTVYAKLKIEAEKVLEEIGPEFVGLRYQSVYGEAIQHGYKAVIQKFKETKGKLPVYGDGSQAYDFIHVVDVARANVMAMRHGSGFYNVCTGVKTSILELAKMMGEPEFVEGYTPIRQMVGDPRKAAAELGFRAMFPLHIGLKMPLPVSNAA